MCPGDTEKFFWFFPLLLYIQQIRNSSWDWRLFSEVQCSRGMHEALSSILSITKTTTKQPPGVRNKGNHVQQQCVPCLLGLACRLSKCQKRVVFLWFLLFVLDKMRQEDKEPFQKVDGKQRNMDSYLFDQRKCVPIAMLLTSQLLISVVKGYK